MKPFSFIHAADLHLGSPFKGAGSRLPAAAGRLQSATFDAFSGLIDLCIEKAVDFLLVAGDVFDFSDRSLRAQLTFRDGLARLSEAGIRSFVVLGNHDPREAWSRRITWPDRAHVFSADAVETRVVSAPDGTPVAAVSGISYRTPRQEQNLAARFTAVHPELYQIALLHGNCGSQPAHDAYAPCSVEALKTAGFDYWALGHVHENKILDTRPHIVYPGCIQGLSIRETGAHGCFLVSVSADRLATLSFQPLDRVRWQMVDVSVQGLEALDDLGGAVASQFEGLREAAGERPVICRIRLTGRGPLYAPLRQPAAPQELLEHFRQLGLQHSPPVWVENLEVACQPDADLSRRQAMDDLLGQILNQVTETEADAGILADRLVPVLRDLYENPRLGRILDPPTPAELQQRLREAALICYDLLESDP